MLLLLSTHSRDLCLWGESDHPASGPPASLSLHLASSSITPAASVHKSRGENVVCMWVQLKRWCMSCVWVLQRGHSGNGCDLTSTLCKYDLRKGVLFVLSSCFRAMFVIIYYRINIIFFIYSEHDKLVTVYYNRYMKLEKIK